MRATSLCDTSEGTSGNLSEVISGNLSEGGKKKDKKGQKRVLRRDLNQLRLES